VNWDFAAKINKRLATRRTLVKVAKACPVNLRCISAVVGVRRQSRQRSGEQKLSGTRAHLVCRQRL
jgi:hypothetical protein